MDYETWFANELFKLQNRIDYFFSDPLILETALVHSSFAHEKGKNEHNERLEFLGDAVLELGVSRFLFSVFPQFDEGRLTRARSAIVCAASLSEWADHLGLCDILRIGHGIGRGEVRRTSLCSDAAEALFGAVFADGGFTASTWLIEKYLDFHFSLHPVEGQENDPKSRLQILAQERNLGIPVYEVVSVSGPSHAPRFLVKVTIGGNVAGTGEGNSRKSAEFTAAGWAYSMLLEEGG